MSRNSNNPNTISWLGLTGINRLAQRTISTSSLGKQGYAVIIISHNRIKFFPSPSGYVLFGRGG